MADIQDFGEKIGGARKDVWKSRGLIFSDITEMNDMERKTHIKKDNIWLKPNWEEQIAAGTPQTVAYWQNKMRQSLPPRPPRDDEDTQHNYVEIVGQIRDAVMAVKKPSEIDGFYQSFIRPTYVTSNSSYYVTLTPAANEIITNKVLKAAQSKQWKMEKEAKQKLFGIPKEEQTYTAVKQKLSVHQYDGVNTTLENSPYADSTEHILKIKVPLGCYYTYLRENSEFYDMDKWQKGTYFVLDGNRKPLKINFDTEKAAQDFVESFAKGSQMLADIEADSRPKGEGKTRKGAFVPPQLRHIKRTGPDYRSNRAANSDMFLNDLKFRGGEFGNWLNDKDRQASLDMAYDGLQDLARLLQIRPEDVSLDNSLAIAFGARGRGGMNSGSAHYEPDRQVINLTKMAGAGCLAHEWGHALDHAIGISCGAVTLGSEMTNKSPLPEAFRDLLDSLKYKTVFVAGRDLEELKKPEIERCQKQLKLWIKSVKPGKMASDLEQAWNEATDGIIKKAASFSGGEYLQYRRKDSMLTHPGIEILSDIRKLATNHVIPRDTKRNISMWATDLGRLQKEIQEAKPTERRVKTDFFNGSVQFDALFSRAKHGYWQSSCEMFARAFDCYIADKIKESGERSDYLSAYADSYVVPDGNGGEYAAIPLGEERTQIFEKFDILFENLKERGILHDFTELREPSMDEKPKLEPSREPDILPEAPGPEIPKKAARYEQMSLDDLLFSAAARAGNQVQDCTEHTSDLSR